MLEMEEKATEVHYYSVADLKTPRGSNRCPACNYIKRSVNRVVNHVLNKHPEYIFTDAKKREVVRHRLGLRTWSKSWGDPNVEREKDKMSGDVSDESNVAEEMPTLTASLQKEENSSEYSESSSLKSCADGSFEMLLADENKSDTLERTYEIIPDTIGPSPEPEVEKEKEDEMMITTNDDQQAGDEMEQGATADDTDMQSLSEQKITGKYEEILSGFSTENVIDLNVYIPKVPKTEIEEETEDLMTQLATERSKVRNLEAKLARREKELTKEKKKSKEKIEQLQQELSKVTAELKKAKMVIEAKEQDEMLKLVEEDHERSILEIRRKREAIKARISGINE